MIPEALSIQIIPLVDGLLLPRPATARTRQSIPAGYGVQEQCLPFTAASGLGLIIPSPIRFGHCPPDEVPEGCRAFRSPLPSAVAAEGWVFYVQDNPGCGFQGNAYTMSDLPLPNAALEPGISFFDREDQQDLFKLHLPYIWRTQAEVDTLFLPLLNRPAHLEVQSGLVETDWYANPVNMILRKPAQALHVSEGQDIAHAILIPRSGRAPRMEVAAGHSRLARDTRKALVEWYARHAANRSAYKVIARSGHGRLE